MRKLLVAFSSAAILLSACNKSNTTPTPVSPPATKSPYYFKFAANGQNYDLNADFPQYMPFDNNAIGGYQLGEQGLNGPSAGVRLSWPLGDTVRESDVKSLVGKTLYFDDTTIAPEISFDEATNKDMWFSVDTSDKNFSVKITNVSYLKDDEGVDGVKLKIYVLSGTCNAILRNNDKMISFTNGSFNFIISRRDI